MKKTKDALTAFEESWVRDDSARFVLAAPAEAERQREQGAR